MQLWEEVRKKLERDRRSIGSKSKAEQRGEVLYMYTVCQGESVRVISHNKVRVSSCWLLDPIRMLERKNPT